MTSVIRPVLRYPGAKTRLAPWIVDRLPPHSLYIEPFAGSCAVFLTKAPAKVEVINDLDERVVNLFRVLRSRPHELAGAIRLTPYSRAEYLASDDPADDELEAARRFLVRVWMAHGGKLGSRSGWRQGWAGGSTTSRGSSAKVWKGLPERIVAIADRLRDAMIDCRPALDVLADWTTEEAVVYADPPYPMSVLSRGSVSGRSYYGHDMTDEVSHRELLAALNTFPGAVLLSGYRSTFYDEALAHWRRDDIEVRAYRQAVRTESLWMNPAAVRRQRTLFTLAGVV